MSNDTTKTNTNTNDNTTTNGTSESEQGIAKAALSALPSAGSEGDASSWKYEAEGWQAKCRIITAERDQLRAELDAADPCKLRGQIHLLDQERDGLRAEVERLRGCLLECRKVLVDECQCVHIVSEVDDVLASVTSPTPPDPQPAVVVECKCCSGTGYMGHGKDNTATACPDCKGTGRSQSALSASQSAGGEGENDYHKLRLHYDKLWDESAEIFKERDALRAQVVTLEAERERMRAEVEERGKHIESLLAAAGERKAEEERLRDEVLRLRDEIDHLNGVQAIGDDNLSNENRKLRAEVERLKAEFVKLADYAKGVMKNNGLSDAEYHIGGLMPEWFTPTPSDQRRVYEGMRVVVNEKSPSEEIVGLHRTIRKAPIGKGVVKWELVDDQGTVTNWFYGNFDLPEFYDPLPAAEPAAEPSGECMCGNPIYDGTSLCPECLAESAKREEKQRDLAGEQAEPVIVLPDADANGTIRFHDGSRIIMEYMGRNRSECLACPVGKNAMHDESGDLIEFPTPLAAARALAAIGQGPGAKVETHDDFVPCPKCGEDRGHAPLCFRCDMAEQIARTPEDQPAPPPFDVEEIVNRSFDYALGASYLAKAATYAQITEFRDCLIVDLVSELMGVIGGKDISKAIHNIIRNVSCKWLSVEDADELTNECDKEISKLGDRS